MATEAVRPNASIASTGLGLRYIGSGAEQHAYAISGGLGADPSDQVALSFTSGSGYILAEFTVNQFVNPANPADFDHTLGIIKFNGEQVANMLCGTTEVDMPSQGFIKIIIPPFTEVLVTLRSASTDADDIGTVVMAGRVYGV